MMSDSDRKRVLAKLRNACPDLDDALTQSAPGIECDRAIVPPVLRMRLPSCKMIWLESFAASNRVYGDETRRQDRFLPRLRCAKGFASRLMGLHRKKLLCRTELLSKDARWRWSSSALDAGWESRRLKEFLARHKSPPAAPASAARKAPPLRSKR